MSEKIIRVLLADDHVVVRAGIRQILEHAGDIEVVAEAEDGEQAKALIQKHMPDVAVLDIQMPKASGSEVTRWVRANLQTIGLLILTAYDDTPYVMGVLQAGANGFTFTNKAANELKERVIRYLVDLADPEKRAKSNLIKNLLPQLTGPLKLSEEQIGERAEKVLKLILHNYGEFSISTIDTFTHRVIRTCTRP